MTGSDGDGDEDTPEQQELAPLEGGERLARVEELREALEAADDAESDSD